MSLTPMEWRGEPEDEAGGGERVRGVRRRLRRLLSRAVERVSGWVRPPAPDGGADPPASTGGSREPEGVRSRMGGDGRARLESGPEVRQLPAASPPDSPAGPDRAVEVTVEGDRLRVHEPGSGEAYITSDVYERVER